MSLNLNSLLNEYNVELSLSSRYFWQKEKQTDGLRYPLPINSKYVDLMKLVLGLYIIEIDQLNKVAKELVVETSFAGDFSLITDRLQSLFFYLTGTRIIIKIIPCSLKGTLERLDESSHYSKLVLFSGGLDSLCGAIKSAKQDPTILVHCKTNQVIFHKILGLSQVTSLKRSPLFCFDAITKSLAGGTSNTRGLLFLSSAYTIAASLGIKTILFCENGSQMLDVMLGSLIYPNKPATKNTNPIYLNYIEELFSLFDKKDVRIERPFQELTKAEILYPLKSQIKFEQTFSCFTTRGRAAMCGICYNCFLRRMFLSAINVEEDVNTYDQHPFALVEKEEQTRSYEERLRVIVHLLRNYAKILKKDPAVLDEVKLSARDFFEDPIDLATRTAKDIYLGVMKALKTVGNNKWNALGTKANKLLNQIDKQMLEEREEELMKIGSIGDNHPSD